MKLTILSLVMTMFMITSFSYSQAKSVAKKSASLDVTMAFMQAMGKGDMKKMNQLMADDMEWHNEGDKSLPWIGRWKGKKKVFEFLKIFNTNLKTTSWTTDLTNAKGKDVTMFGTMSAKLTKSGKSTKPFSWALHVVVEGGKVKLWHWFEDSYAVSKAYHDKK